MKVLHPEKKVAEELPMPPPPRGMKPVAQADGDDPEDAGALDEDAQDLEALKALEEVALDPDADKGAVLLQSLNQLGPGNPLRMRLEDVLQDLDQREEAPAELGRVTNLLTFDVSQVADRYDIPVEMQPLVADYIRFFQGPGRRWFRKWMSRSTRYIPVMQPILEKEGIPRDTVYLSMIESGFSVQAYSWAHAAGPWQFIPGTAKWFGLKQDFWVDERRDPIKSTAAAARYLKMLYGELGHWYLAWAGYNTGGGRVRRVCEKKGTSDFWAISEGRGLAKETKHYVPKLIAAALIAKNPAAFGFNDEEFDYLPPLEFDLVPIPDVTDLTVLAKCAGITEDELRELNPELRRWTTPPASEDKPYLLRIPKGTSQEFTAAFDQVPRGERVRYAEHKVRKGDTLSAIAQRYGSSPEAIMRLNELRSARALRLNTVLMIPVPMTQRARVQQARDAKLARRAGYTHDSEQEVPAGTPSVKVAQGSVKTEVIGGRTRISYGVQNGDTLWGICQRFNCSVEDLRKWNGLSRRGHGLQVGTLLAIWQDKSDGTLSATAPARAVAVPASDARVHELRDGETLWSVAQQYGVTVADLKQWNGIRDHRHIRAGQKLRLAGP